MVQVMNLVERRLELSGVFVYGIVVHDRVVHHDGQAVDVAFRGDSFHFSGRDICCVGDSGYE
ncbi:hypothetical protein D3C73_1358070 [compost metagenome]